MRRNTRRGRKEGTAEGIDSLLLGAANARSRAIGFHKPNTPSPSADSSEELVTYDGDAHLVTVAPTRSGKGTGVIIPNLLSYRGPVVVFDPKGENYLVTARYRREMGQQVVKLDPFGVIDSDSDALNPLDVFDLDRADLESDAQSLAELISRGITGLKEPFWDLHGSGLHSALIAHAATKKKPDERNLCAVIDGILADDVVHSLAVLLDTAGKNMNRMAYREIAAFLQMPDITRGGVLATAVSYIKAFVSPTVSRVFDKSTFDLKDVVEGKPLSIYLIIPPDRLHSHRAILKLWVGTLLKAVLSRRHRPQLRTLFLLDEAAQLETFPLLETMITLCGGYGTWVWTFWQDLDQIQKCYPNSWKTILNNCGSVQTFGFYNRDMATQWSSYLDTGVHQLRSLRPEEQMLAIHHQGEHRCRRLNYLQDEMFAGRFDANRFYTQTPAAQPKADPGTHSSSLNDETNRPQQPSMPA